MRQLSALIISILVSLFGYGQIPALSSPYADFGSYTVVTEIDAATNPNLYTFRPQAQSGETFPVFFFQLGANGFGSSAINANTYDIFLEHLASYGYIVILVNSSAAGFPNGSVYQETYDWYLEKLADQNHWISSTADPSKVVIGGHSLGGVQATAFLENNQTVIDGIVYFASFPSQGVLGIGAHDIDNYSGNLLSIAGTEDEDSTPVECREGYDTYEGTECKYWVLVDGLGHAGFGDYETSGQTVGSIGRQNATATIRHYLVSFMEYTFKNDATAEQNLKDITLRPDSEAEFETTCPAIVTSTSELSFDDLSINIYPNPTVDVLIVDPKFTRATIIAVDGRVVIRDKTLHLETVSVSSLPSGTYFIELSDAMGKQVTSSFVKY